MNTSLSTQQFSQSQASFRLAFALVLAQLLATVATAQSYSVDEVVDVLERSRSQIESIHVKTRVSSRYTGPKGRELAINFGTTYVDDYATSGDEKIYRLRRWWERVESLTANPSLRANEALAWREEKLAFDGEKMLFQNVSCSPSAAPEIHNAIAGGPDKLANHMVLFAHKNIYSDGIGCPFYSQDFPDVWYFLEEEFVPKSKMADFKDQHPFSVVEALKTGVYSVLQAPETVGETSTIVLESDGWDKIWLAPSLGFAVVKRELRHGADGRLVVRFVNEQFEKLTDDLWLPRQVTREVFGFPSHGDPYKNRVVLENIATVTDFVVNNVPDDLFTFQFPQGAYVVDFNHVTGEDGKPVGVTYGAGADEETTQLLLENAIVAHQGTVQTGGMQRRYLLWIFAGIIAAGIVSLVMYRVRKPR